MIYPDHPIYLFFEFILSVGGFKYVAFKLYFVGSLFGGIDEAKSALTVKLMQVRYCCQMCTFW